MEGLEGERDDGGKLKRIIAGYVLKRKSWADDAAGQQLLQ